MNTPRLLLVPGSVDSVRAEIYDHSMLARILHATVPDNWPPESMVDALPLFLGWLEAAPEMSHWYVWYALAHSKTESAGPNVLVASGGFLGPPVDGQIQIGYSVLPQFQNLGYATELVQALVKWAFQSDDVCKIVAETEWENPASVRVLTKAGFQCEGAPDAAAQQSGGGRFELHKSRASHQ